MAEENDEVPVTYKRTVRKTDYNKRKIEFTKADGTTKVKLEFPIYEDQANFEILLKLMRNFKKTVDRYDLFTLLGEAEVYDKFQQCLGGDALDTWENLLTDEDEVHWETNLASLRHSHCFPFRLDFHVGESGRRRIFKHDERLAMPP